MADHIGEGDGISDAEIGCEPVERSPVFAGALATKASLLSLLSLPLMMPSNCSAR